MKIGLLMLSISTGVNFGNLYFPLKLFILICFEIYLHEVIQNNVTFFSFLYSNGYFPRLLLILYFCAFFLFFLYSFSYWFVDLVDFFPRNQDFDLLFLLPFVSYLINLYFYAYSFFPCTFLWLILSLF